MSLARLRALLEAYGANPDRWPAEERSAALALLAQSPEAQGWRDASAHLDALLDQAPTHEGSAALIERIVAAARARTLTPIRTFPPDGRVARRVRARRALAMAMPLAAAAAVVLWLLTKLPRVPVRTAVTLAEIGSYNAPTDALLEVPSVRALDRVPTFGCTGAGLGCLDSEAVKDESRSALDSEKYA